MSYLPGLRAALIEAAERAAEPADAAVTAGAAVAAGTAQQQVRFGRQLPFGRRVVMWVRSSVFHPTPRSAVVNLALIVVSVAVGLTATGVFKRGTTLGSSTPATPGAREGVAIPSTAELLAIRTPDPAGGLPWGLRVVRTTRGLTCVSLGRVDYGTVGVLGIDGAFGDDDRFHPLSLNYLVNLGCDVTDAAGHGFVNVGLRDVPASGLWGERPTSVGGCAPTPAAAAVSTAVARRFREHSADVSPQAVCPAADMREVYFGLLGPDAESIRYLLPDGAQRSLRVMKGSGAYLIVLPLTAGAGNPMASGDSGGPNVAAGEITQVRYRDGHVCNVPRASLMGSCPPVGFVAPHRIVPSASRLASHISVKTVAAKSYCDRVVGDTIVACEGQPPHGFRHLEPGGEPALLVRVSFVSHVAITSSASYYTSNLVYPHSHTCDIGGTGGPTSYDIRAGQRVHFDTLIPDRCPGVVRGTISYVPTTGPANSMPIIGLPGQGHAIPVGRFSVRVP